MDKEWEMGIFRLMVDKAFNNLMFIHVWYLLALENLSLRWFFIDNNVCGLYCITYIFGNMA